MSRVSPLGTCVAGASTSGGWPARASSLAANVRSSSAGRHHGQPAAGRPEIGAPMHPQRIAFPVRPSGDERVEAEMAQFVSAVGGQHDVHRRRCGEQRAQRLQPAHQPAAAFGGGLPPGAARRHHHDRRTRVIATSDGRDDVAGGCRRASVVRDQPPVAAGCGGGEHRRAGLARYMDRRRAVRRTNPSAFSRPRPGCAPRHTMTRARCDALRRSA